MQKSGDTFTECNIICVEIIRDKKGPYYVRFKLENLSLRCDNFQRLKGHNRAR